MYALLDRRSRQANPRISFLADYRRANRAAGVEKITIGRLGPLLSGGAVRVPVKVTTEDFGTLEGTMTFKASEDEQGEGRVAWTPALRLPGLEEGEEVRRRSGRQPQRANIYAAGGQLLNSDPDRRLDRRHRGRQADRARAHLRRPPRPAARARRCGSATA